MMTLEKMYIAGLSLVKGDFISQFGVFKNTPNEYIRTQRTIMCLN